MLEELQREPAIKGVNIPENQPGGVGGGLAVEGVNIIEHKHGGGGDELGGGEEEGARHIEQGGHRGELQHSETIGRACY